MAKVRFTSGRKTIGRWTGWDYSPPSAWKHADLDEILSAVAEIKFGISVRLIQAQRHARNLLLKSKVSHTKIKELLGFEGDINSLVEILNQLDPKGKNQPLRKALIELRSAKIRARLDAFYKGALGFQPTMVFDHTNKIMNSYLDAVQDRMRGTQTANQTLEVKTIEVGSGYAQPVETDESMGHIIGAGKTWNEVDILGYQTTWITHFGLNDNNGEVTEVTALVNTNELTVNTIGSLAIGKRIEVQASAGAKKVTITDISGSTITLSEPVTGVVIGDSIVEIWGESGIKGNADGTTLFTHSRFANGGYTKTENKSILVESAIIERSASA